MAELRIVHGTSFEFEICPTSLRLEVLNIGPYWVFISLYVGRRLGGFYPWTGDRWFDFWRDDEASVRLELGPLSISWTLLERQSPKRGTCLDRLSPGAAE